MKKLVRISIFGMANINPKKSGLPVVIWADHGGISRNVSNNKPRVKIGNNNYWASVSISPDPEILSISSNIKKSELDAIVQGIDYLARNCDIFLKHYNDIDFSFDDEDLYAALRDRGEYL